MSLTYVTTPFLDRELKKSPADGIIRSPLEYRPRQGYEIGPLIELRSRGAVRLNVASFYPLLYRRKKRNWIRGPWIEKARRRYRRYYRLTPAAGKHWRSNATAGPSLLLPLN